LAYVQIPKDLTNVKTKVAFNLTRRQLIGFGVAGIIGIPTYLKTRNILGNDLAVFLMIILTIPIFFVVFYEKDGLTCEKYLKYIYLHERHQPKVRVSKEKFIEMRKEEQSINGEKSNSAKEFRKKKKTGRKASKKGKRAKKSS
jgi:hypothetical protein